MPGEGLQWNAGAFNLAWRRSAMHIKVLGTGCPKTHATVGLIERSLKRHGLDIPVYRIEDIRHISLYAVTDTPAVVIDGMVVHAGGIPSSDEVEHWLAKVAQAA
jgi:small redox-active disulfide protein 2